MITQPEIARAIDRLIDAGFTPPKRLEGYVRAVHDSAKRSGRRFDSTHLTSAVSLIIDSESAYWPKPAKLLGAMSTVLADELRMDGGRSPDGWNGVDPCPVCGAAFRELGPAEQVQATWDDEAKAFRNMAAEATGPRMGILHDRRKHEDAGVPAIGYWR